MMQHIHDMRAANAGRVIQPRVLEAAFLQVGDAVIGVIDHVLLAAKDQRLGRAGLDTGRLQPDHDPIGAQRAFVGLAVLLREARHVERAAGHAVAAADAVLLLKIDDAVAVLDDRPRRRAGFQAAGIGAVHAAILADQPFQRAVLLMLGKAHQRPAILGEVVRVLVGTLVDADVLAQIVPLLAGRLAGLAADALADVDELGHLGHLPLLRRWRRGGRAPGNIQGLQRHDLHLLSAL